MGTYTTNYQMYMPSIGEQGWGTLVNGNFTTIDTTMKRLDTRIGVLEPLLVIQVDENQNVTFPADVTVNGVVNGDLCVNVSSINDNSVGSYLMPTKTSTKSGIAYVDGNDTLNYGEPIVVDAPIITMKKGFAIASITDDITTHITLFVNLVSFAVTNAFTFAIYVNDESIFSHTPGNSNNTSATYGTDTVLKAGDIVTCSMRCTAGNYGSQYTGSLTLTVGSNTEIPLYLA